MEIASLSKVDFQTLYQAFHLAFADYEVQINQGQLQAMLKRRGFDPDLSFAAFEGDEIVSFTLNGIGNFNGIPTAYDTGTGTLKKHRGEGLATKIFNHAIPFLKERHIEQYLLEVLQHNTKAVSVYRNLGFEITREFNYFVQKVAAFEYKTLSLDYHYRIEQINLKAIESATGFWDFYPSWQNSLEAIKRSEDEFVMLGAYAENELTGYCVFEPASGDVTQIAVDRHCRRKGIATRLLHEAIKFDQIDTLKIINTDISCGSMNFFLRASGIPIKGRQYEMIKKL